MTIDTSNDTQTRWFGEQDAPLVVLAHDWMGRLPWADALAERLAGEGFRVALPDFFAGRTTTDTDDATALLQERIADMEGAFRILSETIGEARATGARHVGLLGFSMGSTIALEYAGQGSVDAVVAYYGSVRDRSVVPRVPILFQLAEDDTWDDKESPEDFQARLAREGFDDVTIQHYDGAQHGFANAQFTQVANAEAAERAWPSTLAFLREHLAG